MYFESDTNTTDTPIPPIQYKHSESMAMASIVLGSIALLTCGCIYVAIVCGSLGIIFALLSKGGMLTLNTNGRIGLTLSAMGLIFSIVFFAVIVITMLLYYGGMEGILQEYMNILGADTMEELYQMLGIYE